MEMKVTTGNGQTKASSPSVVRTVTAHHVLGDDCGVTVNVLDKPDKDTQSSYEYMFDVHGSKPEVQYQLRLRKPGSARGVPASAVVAALLDHFRAGLRGTGNCKQVSASVPRLEFVLEQMIDLERERAKKEAQAD
jgi:hypothetical protein